MIDNVIKILEQRSGYSFKDKDLVLLALSHTSYVNEKKKLHLISNERIEFLGDAVLNLVISDYFYNNHPEFSEGEMTKIRASIVCEASLVKCSEKINLGNFLLLGKGEDSSGGRTRDSILCDAFEALIGAIYTDGGLEKAKKFILEQMTDIIKKSVNGISIIDYKTQLQEYIQRNSNSRVTYKIIKEEGPDHNKLFVSCVSCSERVLGTGEGKTKKEAEQNAARFALENLEKGL